MKTPNWNSALEGVDASSDDSTLRSREEEIIISVTALLLLSPIGANYLLVFGGNYYPEPAALLLAAYAASRSDIFNKLLAASLFSVFFVAAFALSLISLAVSLATHDGTLLDFYPSLRSFTVFLLGASIVLESERNTALFRAVSKRIVKLCMWTIIWSTLYYLLISPESVKKAYSITALVLLSLFAAKRAQPGPAILCIGVFLFCAVTSAYRAFVAYAVIATICIVMSLALSDGPERGMRLHRVIGAVALVVALVVGLNLILPYLQQWVEADASRYHQIVYKFEQQYSQLLDGTFTEESDARLAMLQFAVDHGMQFIFPGGFYARMDYSMWSPWGSEVLLLEGSSPVRDGGLIFMLMTFGYTVTIACTVAYAVRLLQSLGTVTLVTSIRNVLTLSIFVALFFSMGNIFLIFDVAFYFGAGLMYVSSRRDPSESSRASSI